MATRIVMANGDHLTVNEPIESVAEKLGGGSLTRLERPWGDTSIFVNPSEVAYLEEQTDRTAASIDEIESRAAASPAPPAPAAPGSAPAAGATPGAAPGTPGGPPIQPGGTPGLPPR